MRKMKPPVFSGRKLLDLPVIEAACEGDSFAVETVLLYYDAYINKICTRTLGLRNGTFQQCVDEHMKQQLQAKLTEAIVKKIAENLSNCLQLLPGIYDSVWSRQQKVESQLPYGLMVCYSVHSFFSNTRIISQCIRCNFRKVVYHRWFCRDVFVHTCSLRFWNS